MSSLTHRMYKYPASMQAAAAKRLFDTVLPCDAVLDPFCGGGTTLIEAMRSGRLAFGTDLSPLALFVASGRTWLASDEDLARVLEAASAISCAAAATAPTTAISKTLAAWDPVHDALRAHLQGSNGDDSWVAAPLWFCVLCAQQSMVRLRHQRRGRIRAPEHFLTVTRGYIQQLRLLRAEAPSHVPPVRLRLSDGRSFALDEGGPVVAGESTSVQLEVGETLGAKRQDTSKIISAVLTSPPYPGVYDYLSEARRARTLLPRQNLMPSEFPPSQGRQLEEASSAAAPAAARATAAVTTAAVASAAESRHRCSRAQAAFASAASPFLATTVPEGREWPKHWDSSPEIGACRGWIRDVPLAQEKWKSDQITWMEAASLRMVPGARVAVVVGDGGGVDTKQATKEAAEAAGLEFLAGASLAAPGERREHCLLFGGRL